MILSFQLQFAFSYSDLSLGLLSVAGANAATNSGENSPHRLPWLAGSRKCSHFLASWAKWAMKKGPLLGEGICRGWKTTQLQHMGTISGAIIRIPTQQPIFDRKYPRVFSRLMFPPWKINITNKRWMWWKGKTHQILGSPFSAGGCKCSISSKNMGKWHIHLRKLTCPLKRGHFKREGSSSNHFQRWFLIVLNMCWIRSEKFVQLKSPPETNSKNYGRLAWTSGIMTLPETNSSNLKKWMVEVGVSVSFWDGPFSELFLLVLGRAYDTKPIQCTLFLSCWNLPKTDWIIWWLLICSSFLWKMVMPDSWLLITIRIIQKTSQFFGVNEETSPKNHPAKNLLFSELGQVPSLKLTARTWNGMILQEPLPKHTSRAWRRRCTTPRCRSRCGSRGCSRSCRMHRVVGQEQVHILGQRGKKKCFNAQYSTGRLRSRDHWNDHFPRDDCPKIA